MYDYGLNISEPMFLSHVQSDINVQSNA